MEKGEKLLEEELDIIRIIKSIRMMKKEDKNKFIIDLDDNFNESVASHFDKTQILDKVIEMQVKEFKNKQIIKSRLQNQDFIKTNNKN